jgi:hypothetical protein
VTDVLTTVSALHVLGVLALDLTALAVMTCCLHVREAHGSVVRRRERVLLALAVVAVVAVGATGHDLAITAVVDLALLLAVGTPALADRRL